MNPPLVLAAFSFAMVFAGGELPAQSAVTTAPYVETFDGVALGPEWTLTPDPLGGRIALTIDAQPSPGSGGTALLMDSLAGGPLVTNEAVLRVDVLQSGVKTLVYLAREVLDEEDPGEGVWISDGQQEALVFSHMGLGPSWTEVEIDLEAEALAAGIAFDADFRILFRQSATAALPFDGLFVDDLRLLPPDDSGQANRADAWMDLSGGLNVNGRPPTVGRNGPFFAESSVFDLIVRGEPNRPWLLLRGPLGTNNALFGAIGSLDLGLLAPNLGDVTILLDGNMPTEVLDLFAVLGPTGESRLTFAMDFLPPGLLGSFQTAVYVSGPDVLHLSAAFQLSVAP